MDEWIKIALETVAGGLILAGLTAGVSKVWHLGTTVARVEQKLDDHISSEKDRYDGWGARFDRIESKLPNGDIKRVLDQLNALSKKLDGGS